MLLIYCGSPINLLGFIVSNVLFTTIFIPVILLLLLKALAYLLSLPSVYIILNLNLPSRFNHRVYLRVSSLEVVK